MGLGGGSACCQPVFWKNKWSPHPSILNLYWQKCKMLFTFSHLATAELFKNEGNDEFRKKDFSNAILLYTKGIKVNCKDEELNAKLYSNRATAHFNQGEEFWGFHSFGKLTVFQQKMRVLYRSFINNAYLFLLIFSQVTSMIRWVMQRLLRTYIRLTSKRLL